MKEKRYLLHAGRTGRNLTEKRCPEFTREKSASKVSYKVLRVIDMYNSRGGPRHCPAVIAKLLKPGFRFIIVRILVLRLV